MNRECIRCGDEYEDATRKGKPGRITECDSCGEESETTAYVKGIIETDNGDFAEVRVVKQEEFEAYKQGMDETAGFKHD